MIKLTLQIYNKYGVDLMKGFSDFSLSNIKNILYPLYIYYILSLFIIVEVIGHVLNAWSSRIIINIYQSSQHRFYLCYCSRKLRWNIWHNSVQSYHNRKWCFKMRDLWRFSIFFQKSKKLHTFLHSPFSITKNINF